VNATLPPRSWRLLALAGFLLLIAGAARAQPFAMQPEMPGVGPVLLALPRAASPAPVVIVVPDPAGFDQRGRPYTDRLNAQGIATIEIQPGPATAATAQLVAQRLGRLLRAIIADRRFDPARVAVLGFGGGARIALSGAAGLPVAALNPGCAPPRPPGAGRTLQIDAEGLGEMPADCPASADHAAVRSDPRAMEEAILRVAQFMTEVLRTPRAGRPSPSP
jgi:dienelactone hydrolase